MVHIIVIIIAVVINILPVIQRNAARRPAEPIVRTEQKVPVHAHNAIHRTIHRPH